MSGVATPGEPARRVETRARGARAPGAAVIDQQWSPLEKSVVLKYKLLIKVVVG